ncbi:MAG: GNAT family N-acetyltransferase [Bacteroidales bacterium]
MITFREQLVPEDIRKIGEVLESSGFFHSYEVDVARELASLNLEKGAATSGYHFIVAHEADTMLGYCCYGPNPCTESSYDLYWIAVHKDHMKMGLGRQLMHLAEQAIEKLGGTLVWVETSGRAIYESTRKFYLSLDYDKVAALPDFYAPGDDKIVFMKRVG